MIFWQFWSWISRLLFFFISLVTTAAFLLLIHILINLHILTSSVQITVGYVKDREPLAVWDWHRFEFWNINIKVSIKPRNGPAWLKIRNDFTCNFSKWEQFSICKLFAHVIFGLEHGWALDRDSRDLFKKIPSSGLRCRPLVLYPILLTSTWLSPKIIILDPGFAIFSYFSLIRKKANGKNCNKMKKCINDHCLVLIDRVIIFDDISRILSGKRLKLVVSSKVT